MTKKTLFTEIVGENSSIKVIEFFVENRELDFGVGDVSAETSLSRQSVYTVVDKLLEKDIVKKTRQLQNKQLYQFNNGSPIAEKVKDLFDAILVAI